MLGGFRRGEANDPEIYAASVAAILSDYPEEVINFATDPRTGLQTRFEYPPSLKAVREECERLMLPIRRDEDREERERQYRALPPAEDRSKRPSFQELADDCAKVGIFIGGRRRASQIVTAESACETLGITKEQFDSIPDRGRTK